jgi:hypothetical protein
MCLAEQRFLPCFSKIITLLLFTILINPEGLKLNDPLRCLIKEGKEELNGSKINSITG